MQCVCVCVLPGEAPQYEAQATVGVQADGYLTGRVQLALQLDGATQSTGGSMGHLNTHTHTHRLKGGFPSIRFNLRVDVSASLWDSPEGPAP